jgi:hypothetical protein
MNLNIYKNEVLAELLNSIDSNIFKNFSNKEIGAYLKGLILDATVHELKINYVSKEELLKIRTELRGRNKTSKQKSEAEKLIGSITNSDYQELKRLLGKNNKLTTLLKKDFISDLQSSIAKNKRANPLYKAAENIYKANTKITAKELARELRNGDFDDFKYEDPDDVFVMPGYAREVKGSGIKHILTRIKKEFKKNSR